jgi:hypothetical protein
MEKQHEKRSQETVFNAVKAHNEKTTAMIKKVEKE